MEKVNVKYNDVIINGIVDNKGEFPATQILHVRHPECDVTLLAIIDSKIAGKTGYEDAIKFCNNLRKSFKNIKLDDFEVPAVLDPIEYSQKSLKKVTEEMFSRVPDKSRVMFSTLMVDGTSVCVASRGNIRCYSDIDGLLVQEDTTEVTPLNPTAYKTVEYSSVSSMFLMNRGVYGAMSDDELEDAINYLSQPDSFEIAPSLTQCAKSGSDIHQVNPAVIGFVKQSVMVKTL